MIWHFSPADCSVIEDMPENYQDYIDRMDSAVEAYMKRQDIPDNDVFEISLFVEENTEAEIIDEEREIR